VVADPERALQEMARARRDELGYPWVAVTGSVGKTTTKEMIATAIAPHHRVAKSEGNLNNHLGIPLSLLRAPQDATVGVCELGMSAPGEIQFLAEMVRPTIGVVTNVAAVHLESLGTIEAIAQAKGELPRALPRGGYALLNWDDARVRAMAADTRATVVSYGFAPDARLRATEVFLDEQGTLFEVQGGGAVRIPLWGRHLVYAALAALAAAELLDVPATEARDALALYKPAAGRSAHRPLGRAHLIDDSYNASPASVRAAIEALCEGPAAGARIAALGDMLELGPQAAAFHAELGAFIAERPIDLLLLFGPLSAATRDGALAAGMRADRVRHFDLRADLAAALRERLRPGDRLLVKGSRSMAMDDVIARIEGDLPPALRSGEAGR
jgi:UDP-N-acetylmuramoyl-tripeptide--D-alanyl-D-alanine ligase